MSRSFHQLSYEDRVAISTPLRAGKKAIEIANHLGVHRSTISRELRRNSLKIGYLPLIAARRLETRRKRCLKLNNDKSLREAVLSKLKLCWSPEQIARRFKRENGGKARISHESIYTYTYSDYGIRNRWYDCLRRKRKWRLPRIGRKQRMQIPNRIGIAERPTEINNRQTFGHWEGDLMVFGRGSKTNLITLRERKSRYMIAVVNPSKHSKITASNIIKALRSKQESVNSITFDNGLEFSKHEIIAKRLKAKTYFCEPYKPYQKGSVENGNGLLRIDLPRNINSELISATRVSHLVKLINHRPMKCLGYQTPAEVFHQYTVNL